MEKSVVKIIVSCCPTDRGPLKILCENRTKINQRKCKASKIRLFHIWVRCAGAGKHLKTCRTFYGVFVHFLLLKPSKCPVISNPSVQTLNGWVLPSCAHKSEQWKLADSLSWSVCSVPSRCWLYRQSNNNSKSKKKKDRKGRKGLKDTKGDKLLPILFQRSAHENVASHSSILW